MNCFEPMEPPDFHVCSDKKEGIQKKEGAKNLPRVLTTPANICCQEFKEKIEGQGTTNHVYLPSGTDLGCHKKMWGGGGGGERVKIPPPNYV